MIGRFLRKLLIWQKKICGLCKEKAVVIEIKIADAEEGLQKGCKEHFGRLRTNNMQKNGEKWVSSSDLLWNYFL